MMNNAVEAHGLSVRRGGREVLHELDFTLTTGEVTGLLGPSGCGKSTLMRVLAGVQAHVTGEVAAFGEKAGSRALRHRIGYQTQDASVYVDLSVEENLRFFAKVLGLGREEVERCIEAVDLADHADQVVDNLSGGQIGRANLAVALLGQPDLLILDEPTVGLDPVLREDLWGLFHRIAEAGAAVLVSSHVMDEAERCDRLLLMRDGVFLADGTPRDIKEKAGADDVERAFLALVRGVAA